MKITIKDPLHNRYYVADVSSRWANKHDNGALISCGLTVGEKSLSRPAFEKVAKKEISKDDWAHSSCQSGCVRRGAPKCRW